MRRRRAPRGRVTRPGWRSSRSPTRRGRRCRSPRAQVRSCRPFAGRKDRQPGRARRGSGAHGSRAPDRAPGARGRGPSARRHRRRGARPGATLRGCSIERLRAPRARVASGGPASARGVTSGRARRRRRRLGPSRGENWRRGFHQVGPPPSRAPEPLQTRGRPGARARGRIAPATLRGSSNAQN